MTSRLRAICAVLIALATLTCFGASGFAGPRCDMPSIATGDGGCKHCAPEVMTACMAQCLVVIQRIGVMPATPATMRLHVYPTVELVMFGRAAEPSTPPPRSSFG